jgi:hypothetical protein
MHAIECTCRIPSKTSDLHPHGEPTFGCNYQGKNMAILSNFTAYLKKKGAVCVDASERMAWEYTKAPRGSYTGERQQVQAMYANLAKSRHKDAAPDLCHPPCINRDKNCDPAEDANKKLCKPVGAPDGWSNRKLDHAKWPTKAGHVDVLSLKHPQGGANRRRIEEELEASANQIKFEWANNPELDRMCTFNPVFYKGYKGPNPSCIGKYGEGLSFGSLKSANGGEGKAGRCFDSNGPSSAYGGYALMWDQDAVQPLNTTTYNHVNLEHWNRGTHPFPAGCAIPPSGVPPGAHLLRVVPCKGAFDNSAVFCTLVKITEGSNPLVEGFGDIVESAAPMSQFGVNAAESWARKCEDKAFYLRNMATKGKDMRCVYSQLDGTTQKNGAKLVWDKCNRDTKKFEQVDTADGDRSFFLKNKHKGRCIHAEALNLVVRDGCSGEENKFIKVEPSEGTCYRKTPKCPRRSQDAQADFEEDEHAANDKTACLETRKAWWDDRCGVTDTETRFVTDGSFYLKHKSSGRCVQYTAPQDADALVLGEECSGDNMFKQEGNTPGTQPPFMSERCLLRRAFSQLKTQLDGVIREAVARVRFDLAKAKLPTPSPTSPPTPSGMQGYGRHNNEGMPPAPEGMTMEGMMDGAQFMPSGPK